MKQLDPVVRVVRWCCLNCGQIYFAQAGEQPPDMCAYCQDMTTWRCLNPVLEPASNHVARVGVGVWGCLHCGQQYFAVSGELPPQRCRQCHQSSPFELLYQHPE